MKTRMVGIAAAVLLAVVCVPGPSGAQSINDLQQELQKVLLELAETVREAGNQWRQALRLDPSLRDTPLSFMLEHKDALELSAEQVDALEKLRSRFERAAIRREAEIKVARLELDELLDADTVDLEKAEEKIREVEQLRGDEKLSRIRTVEEAKAVLRPEQREKLAALGRDGFN